MSKKTIPGQLELNLTLNTQKELKMTKQRIRKIKRNIRLKNIWLHKIKKYCLKKIKVDDNYFEEALICLIKIKEEYFESKKNPNKPKREFEDVVYGHAPEYFSKIKEDEETKEIIKDPDWGFFVAQSRKTNPYKFFQKLKELEKIDLSVYYHLLI